jgi:hypothetical protein
VCGSRAWARSRLGCVTPESATYALLCRAFLENQSQPQNLLSESLYLLRDNKLGGGAVVEELYYVIKETLCKLGVRATTRM